MAELLPEQAFWLAILGIATPIIAATLTALFTHLWTSSRENYAKKTKIIGWLEWLKAFLEQVDDFPRGEQRLGKLPWWADYTMQNIGDSLHVLPENTRKELLNLVNECWVDDPVKRYSLDGHGRIHDALYDKDKVQNMQNGIDKLIKQIKDP